MTSQTDEKQTKERLTIVQASYLALLQEGKVLLLRRHNTGYEDGNYSLVAGHVDSGETFTECTVREVKEEAGIVLDPKDLKVAHVMHRNSGTTENRERVDVFLVAERWRGEIVNKESHKCNDFSRFDKDALPGNTIPYVRHAIENMRNGVFYSEYGWK